MPEEVPKRGGKKSYNLPFNTVESQTENYTVLKWRSHESTKEEYRKTDSGVLKCKGSNNAESSTILTDLQVIEKGYVS